MLGTTSMIATGQIASQPVIFDGGRRSKNQAVTSTTVGFINSEGWKVMMPRLIHRWLPPPAKPISSTATSITSRMR